MLWFRDILTELGIPQTYPTKIFPDNLASMAWSTDMQGMTKAKHVGIKYHSVKDNVGKNSVNITYTTSSENKTDSLTKSLVGSSFKQHRHWVLVQMYEEHAFEADGQSRFSSSQANT